MPRFTIKILVLIAAVGTVAYFQYAPKLRAINGATSNEKICREIHPGKDRLERWIDALSQAESSGRSYITIVDSNGKLSRGCLQFQDDTLIRFGRKFGLWPAAEDSEMPNFAYDCSEAKKLARLMIEDNPRNATHWKNSLKKIGMPPVEN